MYYFVINRNSGSYNKKLEISLQKAAEKYFPNNFQICGTKLKNEFFMPDIDKALTENDFLISVGGDGTLNLCLNYLRINNLHNKVTLGIIPYGTGNNMLLALNLTKNIDKAMKIIKNNKTVDIQFGTINDKYSFFNCSVGFSANILKNRKFKGKFGYILDLLLNIFYSTTKSKLITKNLILEEQIFHGYFLNSTHYVSFIPFLNELPDDEQIYFYYLPDVGIFKGFLFFLQLLLRRNNMKLIKSDFFEFYPADNCYVEIDGDMLPKCDKYIIKYFGKVKVINNLDSFSKNIKKEKT